MNHFLRFTLFFVCPFVALAQPAFVPNYEEQQVGYYSLPDPLQLPKGKRITTTQQWETQRAYWLGQFAEHVYGRTPAQPVTLRYETCNEVSDARGGKAIRKQIAIHFVEYPQLPPIELLLYIPKKLAESVPNKPVPVFLGLNFCGNHCVSTETDLPLSDRWVDNTIGDVSERNRNGEPRATPKSRGTQARRWPIDTILARGYALATAYYGDIEPDHVDGWKTGIRSVLGDSTPGS
ncbi:MAG: acetylxylan esterase, partial [Rudanella sp.]|nr:acetylxylan esterase [Rudanella sp.]